MPGPAPGHLPVFGGEGCRLGRRAHHPAVRGPEPDHLLPAAPDERDLPTGGVSQRGAVLGGGVFGWGAALLLQRGHPQLHRLLF